MTWVSDYKYTWYEKLAMNVIRSGGHLPDHVAFVMDGNRRYAKLEHIRKIDGHSRGFDKLADCLRWCLDMGVKEVSTFAFSIENFKRSEDEVDDLLNLAREKFTKLLEERAKLHEYGVRVRIIGNLSLLPDDLQSLMAQVMLETEKNNKLFLNVAFAYTSRDEITQAIEAILKEGDNVLEEQDINEHLLEQCLYTRPSTPPDLLFRTSGESRISDFLMWQLKYTVLYFAKIFWPEITLWHFLAGIFSYQRASVHLEPFKRKQSTKYAITKMNTLSMNRVQLFLKQLDIYRAELLSKLRNKTF
ncbi:dehydrodolichyl diphosphate synthase complex subunit DHDDS-like [Glossina fuscipes fuscipes]